MWEAGTHVDFDRGLAYCLGQERTALGDSADNPRFVETLPRRGYRFIAPVQAEEAALERREAADLADIQDVVADRLAEAVRRHVIERDPSAPRFTR